MVDHGWEESGNSLVNPGCEVGKLGSRALQPVPVLGPGSGLGLGLLGR